MLVRFVIFDLDGTLANTLDDLAASCNSALETCGFPPLTIDGVRKIIGHGCRQFMTLALPADARSEDHIDRMCEAFNRHYHERYMVNTRAYDGIPRMLEILTRNGVDAAVLSNKQDEYTAVIIQRLFPQIPFRLVMGQRPEFPVKPDPASARHIMEQAGYRPNETAYVGDSDVDMQTAKNAGLMSIGAVWGFCGRGILTDHGADYLAEAPEDILKILARS